MISTNTWNLKILIKLMKMTEYTLRLKDKYPRKLGTGPTAKKIFKKINKHEVIILDFEDIEFMSRSFAQEYTVQKYYSNSKITEINMDISIEKLLEVVKKDFEQTCLKC